MKTPAKAPDLKRLRAFGLILGALLAFVSWRWGLKGWAAAPWVGGVGALFAAVGLACPILLEPVERHWMRGARVMSRISTAVIMTLLFYLVITPYGAFLRAVVGDGLDRSRARKPSYWKPTKTGHDLSSYEKQF